MWVFTNGNCLLEHGIIPHTANILFNGDERYEKRGIQYHNILAKTGLFENLRDSKYISIFPFCMMLDEISGSANFSRMDNIILSNDQHRINSESNHHLLTFSIILSARSQIFFFPYRFYIFCDEICYNNHLFKSIYDYAF